jgi:hypothetical protein
MSKISVTLSLSLSKKLTNFCKKRKIMSGEKYYRVPDYNSAISFLLDGYLKKMRKSKSSIT